jgi:hypothetical protein
MSQLISLMFCERPDSSQNRHSNNRASAGTQHPKILIVFSVCGCWVWVDIKPSCIHTHSHPPAARNLIGREPDPRDIWSAETSIEKNLIRRSSSAFIFEYLHLAFGRDTHYTYRQTHFISYDPPYIRGNKINECVVVITIICFLIVYMSVTSSFQV